MNSVIQLSDPHFGTELPLVATALTRLVKSISPDVLVLSGDITQRARPCQFRAARTFLDGLGISEQLVIPGNHDIPLLNLASRIFSPYSRFRRVFGKELEPVHSSEHLLIIALNTTRRYRHVDGEVSSAQIHRVETLLKNATSAQLRIVVTHQPVSVLQAQDKIDLLHGHAEAIRRWSDAGADLILGGHIHLPYLSELHVQHPGLSRKTWAVQAGTCISSRLRHEAGNSVNLIRYEGVRDGRRHCNIERWDYQVLSNSFEQVSVHSLVCDASADE